MKRIAIAATALGLAGCASNAPQPVRPVSAQVIQQAPVSAATYVAQAASIDLFVIRSSELANLRSVTPAVRQYADRMIADHRGLASQLSFAGRRLDLLPSATLLPQHQAMFEELAASNNFEAAYLRLQRQVHGQGLRLHGDYAARGESATLRPVAANAAAVELRHLEMLRNLRP
jgi:predicted outer membrane protein